MKINAMKIQPQDKLLIQLQVIEPLLDSIISEFDEEVPPPLTEESVFIFEKLGIALDNILSAMRILRDREDA
jgi:hypothetical protein